MVNQGICRARGRGAAGSRARGEAQGAFEWSVDLRYVGTELGSSSHQGQSAWTPKRWKAVGPPLSIAGTRRTTVTKCGPAGGVVNLRMIVTAGNKAHAGRGRVQRVRRGAKGCEGWKGAAAECAGLLEQRKGMAFRRGFVPSRSTTATGCPAGRARGTGHHREMDTPTVCRRGADKGRPIRVSHMTCKVKGGR